MTACSSSPGRAASVKDFLGLVDKYYDEYNNANTPETQFNYEHAPQPVRQVTIRVLIVDDDAGFRALCSRRLRKTADQDYLITEAADAASAMDVISEDTFDCVLVDYRLPDMSGTDLIRAMRQISRHTVPMILMSAEDGKDMTDDAYLAGATSYLPKGRAGKPELVQAIRDAIEKSLLCRTHGTDKIHRTGTT